MAMTGLWTYFSLTPVKYLGRLRGISYGAYSTTSAPYDGSVKESVSESVRAALLFVPPTSADPAPRCFLLVHPFSLGCFFKKERLMSGSERHGGRAFSMWMPNPSLFLGVTWPLSAISGPFARFWDNDFFYTTCAGAV